LRCEESSYKSKPKLLICNSTQILFKLQLLAEAPWLLKKGVDLTPRFLMQRHARLDTTGCICTLRKKNGAKPWNAIASKSKLPPL